MSDQQSGSENPPAELSLLDILMQHIGMQQAAPAPAASQSSPQAAAAAAAPTPQDAPAVVDATRQNGDGFDGDDEEDDSAGFSCGVISSSDGDDDDSEAEVSGMAPPPAVPRSTTTGGIFSDDDSDDGEAAASHKASHVEGKVETQQIASKTPDAADAADAAREVVDLTVSSEAEPPSAKEASAPAESPVPGKKRNRRRVRFETKKKKKKRDGDIVYDFKFNTPTMPPRWALANMLNDAGYRYGEEEKNDSPHHHFAYNAARFFHMRRCAGSKEACCTDQDAYRLLKQSDLPVAAQREIDVGFWYYGFQ